MFIIYLIICTNWRIPTNQMSALAYFLMDLMTVVAPITLGSHNYDDYVVMPAPAQRSTHSEQTAQHVARLLCYLINSSIN